MVGNEMKWLELVGRLICVIWVLVIVGLVPVCIVLSQSHQAELEHFNRMRVPVSMGNFSFGATNEIATLARSRFRTPRASDMYELYDHLLLDANDPCNPHHEISWTFLFVMIGNYMDDRAYDPAVWHWVQTEVLNPSHEIMQSEYIRDSVASMCYELGVLVPQPFVDESLIRRIESGRLPPQIHDTPDFTKPIDPGPWGIAHKQQVFLITREN